jgi:hypothetical protein
MMYSAKCMFMGAGLGVLLMVTVLLCAPAQAAESEPAVPRQWKEELLEAITNDRARPPVHARNLHHLSVAMWDAWAAFDPMFHGYLHNEHADADDIGAARDEAISYAAFRLLWHRFESSLGLPVILPSLFDRMHALGYDPMFDDTEGESPAAVGNRVAQAVIAHGLADGANEADDYANQFYEPINPPLDPHDFGNPDMIYPDHWQQLDLEYWCDQLGNCFPLEEPVAFESPEWGMVIPFALGPEEMDVHPAPGGNEWRVYLDPGPPPFMGNADPEFMETFVQVIRDSSKLDPDDEVMIDISPASLGNNTPGTNDGEGYEVNPVTGQPYQPQWVRRGDYYRVLAEFWADGPASETPPGHWFSILHYVSDHPLFEKRFAGQGEVLHGRDFYVRAYLALGGAVHDAAIAAWSVKGYYDYVRPISAIRYMADRGQSSDPDGPSYHPQGLPLVDGLIEVVTGASSAPGEHHEHLADHIGEIAIRAWAGHVEDPESEYAGVAWILAGDWWPYQQPDFITPPFAGYVSGHSTFSRAAAEAMTRITGSPYFPGGLGEFPITANEFLEFELGPSQDLVLQWASYADAADECALSRIYGGIHPPADDTPGRLMGYQIGPKAFERAMIFIRGEAIFRDRFAGID